MFDTLPPPPGATIPDFGPEMPAAAAAVLALFGGGQVISRRSTPPQPDLSWLEDDT